MEQAGIFDEIERLERLTELGDPLEKLSEIDWDMFVPMIRKALAKTPKGPGGRPRYDIKLMLKVLMLKRMYNLSFEQTEYQINDRLSFMRFLGLTISDKVPDTNTIWNFYNDLSQAQLADKMFDAFKQKLLDEHMILREGSIVDATFVDAPHQRNTRAENEKIKAGEIPEDWKKDEPKAKHKLRQKDTDARWVTKNKERHFGYKNHVKADQKSKLIDKYTVTDASVHDSQAMPDLITKDDQTMYADSAYTGSTIADALTSNGIENQICEKGFRNHPLTDEQKERNRKKSKVRSRVEHIFGFMTGSMNGITVRTIGITRAAFDIGLTNLLYNMRRYCFLCAST